MNLFMAPAIKGSLSHTSCLASCDYTAFYPTSQAYRARFILFTDTPVSQTEKKLVFASKQCLTQKINFTLRPREDTFGIWTDCASFLFPSIQFSSESCGQKRKKNRRRRRALDKASSSWLRQMTPHEKKKKLWWMEEEEEVVGGKNR